VARKIIPAFIAICALALYLYAHHNWHRLSPATTVHRIVVEKSARRLSIFREGTYNIDRRNAQSSFHLALHISYPSDEDSKRAAARGVSAGSDIMLHGIRNGLGWIGAFHRWKDWTAGCVALTDEEIEELWRVTPDGTTIEIRP